MKALAIPAAGLLAVIVAATYAASTASVRTIPTATGEILPEDMGVTSLHEHVPAQTDAALRAKGLAYAVEDLKRAKELGLRTIIDVGPTDDAAVLKQVSAASGVNIVCCTGFYIPNEEQQAMQVEDFEKHMVDEIEHGIQGTSIRPGVIKVATRGLPITRAEKALLIAGARVQKRFRLTMCIHSVSGAAEQQEILEQAGADLAHCYFSHIEAEFGWEGRDVATQIDYLERVVKEGSSLAFNNFGNWNHTKPEKLAAILRELVRRGHEDRLVATMDTTWSYQNGAIKLLWEDSNEDGKDRNYSYLLRKAVPWMIANGIPAETAAKFTVENPRRLFTW